MRRLEELSPNILPLGDCSVSLGERNLPLPSKDLAAAETGLWEISQQPAGARAPTGSRLIGKLVLLAGDTVLTNDILGKTVIGEKHNEGRFQLSLGTDDLYPKKLIRRYTP